MKPTLNNQTRRIRIAFATAVACMTFGAGSVLAAPPPSTPTFAKASIDIEPRGEDQGALNCSFRETGLGSYALISYECKAAAVAVVEGCVYKNRLISATETSTYLDVTNAEGEHGPESLIANASGAINGSVITQVPEGEGGGGGETHLCPETGETNGPQPEQAVVAVRWCNASLTDTTNDIQGASVGELYKEFVAGVGTVPSCSDMLAP